MFIISKFHDYYDSAICHGIDKACIYNRITNDNRDERRRYNSSLYNQKYEWIVDTFIVGFCGKIYPCVKLSPHSTNPDSKVLFFYDVEKLEAYIVVYRVLCEKWVKKNP